MDENKKPKVVTDLRPVVKELLNKVKEVKETQSVDEVNILLGEDWILLRIVPNQKPIYCMGLIS